MSNVLLTGMQNMIGLLQQHASVDVDYSRGSQSKTVKATLGSSPHQAVDDEGIVREWESRDFLIPTAALAEFGLPQLGDRISWNGQQYEVRSTPGTQPFRFSDQTRLLIRVFTKQVA